MATTKVKFTELDGENKLTAVYQIFNFSQKRNYPNGAIWESEGDVKNDLEQGYSPDEHFSFFLDEFEQVETKIG